jgi:hypothetical protein
MSEISDKKIDSAINSQSTHNVDVGELLDFDVATERKVLRKIDMVVLPLMCMIYFFQCRNLPSSSSAFHR